MNKERANYVESEFKKWIEHYEIGFDKEYDVRLLLGLRHQLEGTPDDKIKTKVDLINAINNLQRGLNLKPAKPKLNGIKSVLLIVEDTPQLEELKNNLIDCLDSVILNTKITRQSVEVNTKTHNYRIVLKSESNRGLRADIMLEVNEYRRTRGSVIDLHFLDNKVTCSKVSSLSGIVEYHEELTGDDKEVANEICKLINEGRVEKIKMSNSNGRVSSFEDKISEKVSDYAIEQGFTNSGLGIFIK